VWVGVYLCGWVCVEVEVEVELEVEVEGVGK